MMDRTPLLANLICGGPDQIHDFEFVGRRLHQALEEAGDIRTELASNYGDSRSIELGDLLVSYTASIPVNAEQCTALIRFLEAGGRWFALHSSNVVEAGSCLSGVLGSRFVTHPPYGHFSVSLSKPTDPLLDGIAPFEVEDELYVIDHSDDAEVLLHTRWGGEALGHSVEDGIRPLMYRRAVGKGGVLYLALGHADRSRPRERSDVPLEPDRRGPWDLPVYNELIRRAIKWAAGRRPW